MSYNCQFSVGSDPERIASQGPLYTAGPLNISEPIGSSGPWISSAHPLRSGLIEEDIRERHASGSSRKRMATGTAPGGTVWPAVGDWLKTHEPVWFEPVNLGTSPTAMTRSDAWAPAVKF